jgi:hypothetical protein
MSIPVVVKQRLLVLAPQNLKKVRVHEMVI